VITIVNMTPNSLSSDASQNSEPSLAVNPEKPTDMVGTAFLRDPLGGPFAPIYVSTDGGNTWSLRSVVPGDGSFGTGDISVGFATTSGVLYTGTLNGQTGDMQIMRTSSFTSTTAMTVLVDRGSEDQPWVVAGSVVVSGSSKDRVFVGNNDAGQPAGGTATVDVSQDAATAAPPAGFVSPPVQLEKRPTASTDLPPIRIALHPDGTVYAAFESWASGTFPQLSMNVVVTRDDNWGQGSFASLTDSGDNRQGQRVVTGSFVLWNDTMGQERLGADLAIAVDPTNSSKLLVAWCDRVGGAAGTDWTLHVRRSTDKGQTWSADLRTITNVKNPSLAINSNGHVGLLYQAFTGTRWVTQLEVTGNDWSTAITPLVLHTAPSATPIRTFFPYLGDYVRLLAVGVDYYGVFCGNNTPDTANFPNGVTYQRNADWNSHTLLGTDGTTPVAASIDPFFFHYTEGPILRVPISRIPITRTPIITRTPVITPQPRTPIIRDPIIDPAPIRPEAGPGTPRPAPPDDGGGTMNL
jgi:hypothetical protein